MANPIKYTHFGPQEQVGAGSRYNWRQIIFYGDKNKIAFPIYKREKANLTSADKYYQIEKSVEYRPDLVSFHAYGVPDYWWRIMEMNGMKDILEFKAGRNIKLPGGFLM